MCEEIADNDTELSSPSSQFPNRTRLVLAGIVSHGFDSDCGAPNIPSAHTLIPPFLTWIRDIMAADSAADGAFVTSPPNAAASANAAAVTQTFVRRRRRWL
jgi:hypothetical protein